MTETKTTLSAKMVISPETFKYMQGHASEHDSTDPITETAEYSDLFRIELLVFLGKARICFLDPTGRELSSECIEIGELNDFSDVFEWNGTQYSIEISVGYEQTLYISKKEYDIIEAALNFDGEEESDDFLSEDETITNTVTFPNGYFTDIQCCGVQYEEGGCNQAWTQAVLFDSNGAEVCCTEVGETYDGTWLLKDHDDFVYIVNVIVKNI